jgi:uncharacterized membrane protein YkvA (DUF1232 family)
MSTKELISKVLQSIFFRKATGKAGKIVGNSFLILKLLKDALTKASESGNGKGMVEVILKKVTLFGRLIKAYVKGDYRELPTGSLVKILAALIYFVSPIDLLPDLLPIVGLSDDMALLVWVGNSLANDFSKFEEWEKTSAVELK